MTRLEREHVEVDVGPLDLAVVADLVAEADERVLDLAARLRDRVQPAERERVAGERHVDGFLRQRAGEGGAGGRPADGSLRQRPVELLALERRAPLVERGLEPLADAVQEHAALAVADASQRLRQLALPAEVADARVVQLVERRSGRNRASRLGFVALPVHRPNVPSARWRARTTRSPRCTTR